MHFICHWCFSAANHPTEHFITSTFSLFPFHQSQPTDCSLQIISNYLRASSCVSLQETWAAGNLTPHWYTVRPARGYWQWREALPPTGKAERAQTCWCCQTAGWALCNSASSEDNILLWEPVWKAKQWSMSPPAVGNRYHKVVSYCPKLYCWFKNKSWWQHHVSLTQLWKVTHYELMTYFWLLDEDISNLWVWIQKLWYIFKCTLQWHKHHHLHRCYKRTHLL